MVTGVHTVPVCQERHAQELATARSLSAPVSITGQPVIANASLESGRAGYRRDSGIGDIRKRTGNRRNLRMQLGESRSGTVGD
jgi:hypothetical protein